MRRTAFTLIDLLAVIGLLVVLLAFLLPTVHRNHEYAWPMKCGTNLREIGQAMFEYANANRGAYPRTRYDPNQPTPVAYTGAAATQPFAPDGPKPNDVTAIFYLLVREQGLETSAFICPGTRHRDPFDFGGPGGKAKDFSNFPSERYLGYSVHNPYFAKGSEVAADAWTNRLKADFAIAADMNPGSPALLRVTPSSSIEDLRAAGSRNHPQRGQSVLYGDGHVDLVQSPFAGYSQDNVYTYGPTMPSRDWVAPLSAGIVGPPAHANDSVLLPVATSDPGSVEPSKASRALERFLESGWPARVTLVAVGCGCFFLWRILKDARAARRRNS